MAAFFLAAAFSIGVRDASAQNGPETIKTSLGMILVKIPAGSFVMGAGEGFSGDADYERPAHQVIISKPFWLGVYEVTQDQWSQVMGTSPAEPKRAFSSPVNNVSWDDASLFVTKLSQSDGRAYRLPTEAEWEYAARAGSDTAYHFGSDPELLSNYGWCAESFSKGQVHQVGQKKPNGFGLYDMHGNVAEWVADWFSEDYYAQKVKTDPQGPPSGTEKLLRGGAWSSDPKVCQSAWRDTNLPMVRSKSIGFRVVFDER
ncbi:MAG: formylglycine-generating enzyme family protein [Deltaproteobacteria bacterium]|jgi:formylglycine-generating enzyme required for sulfatase activity|nr:formylglycine-generating enzyme family protein [Deltaproteobacteria bacterium]